MRRKVGTLDLSECGRYWRLRADPHVIQRAKRLWKGSAARPGEIVLDATPANAVDLDWFMVRYPLTVEDESLRKLKTAAGSHEEKIRRVQDYLGEHRPPRAFDLALPPRQYQALEASIVLEQGHLLVADQVGLGKTCAAIAPMSDPRTLPAIVVCMTHLPTQWAREVEKFAPQLKTHIIDIGPVYPLNGTDKRCPVPPDVVIISYSKISKWAQILGRYGNYLVLDECQEIRRRSDGKGGITQKYAAAEYIAEQCAFKCFASATPIYNWGDEIFNILNVMAPGCLGSWPEFLREWCRAAGNGKWAIKNPKAFGTWAREQGLIIRHTREMVGRELPPITRSVQEVGAEAKELEKVEDKAGELARILLGEAEAKKGDKLLAAGQLDNIVRQATGLAKAPMVAEFVKLLVESGEQVLLAAWHHVVYDVLESRFQRAGVRCASYTGKESPRQKIEAAGRFMAGDLDVMMISLRSGAGLDGLQTACRTVVFAELDWSPQVIEQVIGRAARDGQESGVIAYFLVADSGFDPLIQEVLGLKRQQHVGIVDPDRSQTEIFASQDETRGRRLAEEWLKKSRGSA